MQLAIPGIVQRAAELVLPPELPDIIALITNEIANREDGIVNQAVSLTRETVTEQIQRVFPGIAQRAAELVPTPELPDIPALIADEILNREDGIVNRAVSRVSETVIEQIQLAVPDIAQRAADLVPVPEIPPPPELPDIPALIADEISNRESELAERVVGLVKVPALPDINAMIDHRVAAAFVTVRVPQDGADADPEVTAALVQQKVDEAIGRLAPTFVSQAEIEVIAQAVVDRALAQLPKDISAAEMRTVVEGELARHLEALPKALSADDIDALAQAAAEVAVDRCVPDIAQRAAGLIPPVDRQLCRMLTASLLRHLNRKLRELQSELRRLL
jgi:hypothetical protein